MAKRANDKKKSVFSALTFQVTESYKKARTSLAYSVIKKGCKKFVFTSPFKGEGKTTCAVNVGVALAQQVNTKVIIVDCDLRRPTAHTVLGVYPETGLTNYLNYECQLEKVIVHTEADNLDFISYGAIPPNPSELLASDMMAELIETLEKLYDYIIFDTPPINMVVDVVPLVKMVDGVVLVVRDNTTTYPEVNRAIDALKVNGAKISGIIVNRANPVEKGKREYTAYGRKNTLFKCKVYK